MKLKEALNIFLYQDATSRVNKEEMFTKGEKYHSLPVTTKEAAQACERRSKARQVLEKFYHSLENDSL
tara:strand:+ start:1129 stop:1332 length:204 start_codon:yes stop_codon:yes gene_type:complete